MTVPTGNGEQRGPEMAPGNPGSLPGSRPSRAAANNARNADFLRETPVADQGGFGTEDMERTPSYMGSPVVRPSDAIAVPPDLASMGDGGETFWGM